MKATVLASGSKGNCTYIEGDSGAILIDAGLSAKETLKRLELSDGKKDLIKAILVTHEHTDHIKGLDVLARKLGVPVISTQGTLWEFEGKRKSDKPITLEAIKTGEEFSVDGFFVKAFSTYHDACDPCGFCISENDTMLGFCTDTGQITDKMLSYLQKCDSLILESNHCPIMLENGPYPVFLKERIRDVKRGHLSNNAASECLNKMNGDVGDVILAHLSEENNRPDKALETARKGTGLFADSINFHVSLQHEPAKTIEI
ncbi:MBL fold metallo-hydrolase [Methanoplanus sp. FWC-SCC4]|uniref:MBL fold metallo-hydrolase n=1 Tax=Methanochimaera problematica TaxID=2609417 RepID=A0AA97I2Z7_9EURY|nr:MBL fold metallo-hydrolase [Methanoplanus sp. FWC-SCC4]WOF15356.1 MBL fold metallo-hydrolase [Methanoplanus sp. FWC-SCC4]